MSEFTKRVLSGIIGVIALVAVLYIGHPLIELFVFLLMTIGFLEIRKAFNKVNVNYSKVYCFIIPLFAILEIYLNQNIFFTISLILFVSLFDLLFLRNNVVNSSALTFSAIYLVIGFSSLALIKNPIFIGLVFILAFSSDTFAYLVGISIGKHRLIPDVSPKKSIEGAIGGIIGTALMAFLYLSYFKLSSLGYDIILGVSSSILAQCGDLVASRIKRDTGIKDFGSLIPGHGGILDRFDSVLLVAPVVFIITYYLY